MPLLNLITRNVAKDFEGNIYSIVNSTLDMEELIIYGNPVQSISTVRAKNIKKKQTWFDFSGNFKAWTVEEVKEIDVKTIQIVFSQNKREEEKEETKKEKAKMKRITRKFIKELKMNKVDLKDLIEEMLVNTFLIKQVKEMLEEEKIEFIICRNEGFLKVGNKAYRI